MTRMGSTSFPRIRIGIGAGRYIYLPVLTTTQRNLLSPAAGWLIYNSTTTQVESYNGSAWVAVGTVYGDATFLPLAGGQLSGNITFAGAQTIDTMDPSAHLADLDAHGTDIFRLRRTGEYFAPWIVQASATTVAMVANQLYATPLIVPRTTTFDRIAVRITGAAAAGKKVRLGIYADGTNLYPGALLLDAGTVNADSTGVLAITISQQLTKGFYWLVAVSDGTPTIVVWGFHNTPLGQTASDIALEQGEWTVAFTYAALPDPFTAGGALTSSGYGLLISLRVLSLD